MTTTLSQAALSVLQTADAKEKALQSREMATLWRSGGIIDIGQEDIPDRPARPLKPELRPPQDMPKRGKAGSRKSKIALLHAIAHIEINAIDLAWDVMARRFPGCHPDTGFEPREGSHSEDTGGDPSSDIRLPQDDINFTVPKAFYDDWVKVADDEAKHFMMLEDRLNDLDASYGDLPAHDGLWEASERTATDFAARLAVVPMVLEARGLDVTPGMIAAMEKQGDDKTAAMLQIIHDDEITHVRAGTVWFEAWCAHHGKDTREYWQHLVRTYFKGPLKRPFNDPSREEAGMLRHWYEPLAEDDV